MNDGTRKLTALIKEREESQARHAARASLSALIAATRTYTYVRHVCMCRPCYIQACPKGDAILSEPYSQSTFAEQHMRFPPLIVVAC